MNDNRRGKGREKKKSQDVVGLLLSFVGGLFSVTLFLSLFNGPPKFSFFTAPVIGLTDFLGAVPGLVLCALLTVLGTLLFLSSRELVLGRHLAGILGSTLGLALALGDHGGSIGGVIPSLLTGRGGDVLALVLGLIVLLASVWVTWLGSLPILTRKPEGESPVLKPKVDEPKGVSAAEAAALASDPVEVRSLPTAPPASLEADVRRRGGVPEGAQPLELDDDSFRSAAPVPDPDPGPHPSGDGERADGPLPVPAGHAPGADLAAPTGGEDGPDAPAARPLTAETGPFEAEVKPISPEGGAAGGGPVRPSWEMDPEEEVEAPAVAAEEEAEPEDEPLPREAELEEAAAADDEEVWEEEEEEEVAEAWAEDEEALDEEESEDEDEAAETEEVWAEDEELEGEDEDWEEVEEPEEIHAEDDEEEEEEDEYEEEEPAEASPSPALQPGLFDTEEPSVPAAEADEEEDEAEEPEEVLAEDEPEPDDALPAAAEEAETEEAYVLQPQESIPEPPVAQPDGDEREQLVHAAGCLILEQNRVAVSMLERRFEMDFDQACEILDELQDRGLIGPYKGGRTRDILLSREEWLAKAP